jgi:antitoxin (DNA-binding transcriptional repressor) of toxin-antitoxin stability system
MRTISLAELKQNPSAAIDGVEAGQSYQVTRYKRPVALLVPAPRRPPRGAALSEWSHRFKAGGDGAGFSQEWLRQARAQADGEWSDPWHRP